MKNKKEKIKVKAATQEEVFANVAQALAKLDSATVGQLQASLTAVAEAYIEMNAKCPDQQTKRGLTMAFISLTLDQYAGSVALQESSPLESLCPVSDATN
jgi:hypothetical protein